MEAGSVADVDGDDGGGPNAAGACHVQHVAHGDLLGNLELRAADFADRDVVTGGEGECVVGGGREHDVLGGAGLGLGNREERDNVRRESALGGRGDNLVALLELVHAHGLAVSTGHHCRRGEAWVVRLEGAGQNGVLR